MKTEKNRSILVVVASYLELLREITFVYTLMSALSMPCPLKKRNLRY